jgi:hypothetical protein
VKPEHRRKGLASAMLNYAKEMSGLNISHGLLTGDGQKFVRATEGILNKYGSNAKLANLAKEISIKPVVYLEVDIPEDDHPSQATMDQFYSRLLASRSKMIGHVSDEAINDFESLIHDKASTEELMDWGDRHRVWLGPMELDTGEQSFSESISKKQLTPVVQSFKTHASRLRPENKLQSAMGPQAWGLQVDQATQDFENYLSRITKRILGRLKNGEYAPRSAMNNRNRPMDVDDKNRELSKVGSKATRDISKILGV